MTAAAPAGDQAPIGWTELDDISQAGTADADENREYSFEEADAATLAELGLAQPDDTVILVPLDEPAVEEAPKPRRGRKPAAATDAASDAKADEPAKPRRSRGRASSSGTPASTARSGEPASKSARPRGRAVKATDDVPAAAAEPKPRARSRAKPAAESAPTEGAEEGIWQRFRGARTKAP